MAGTCPHCGTSISGHLRNCPKCGSYCLDSQDKCPECGNLLEAPVAESTLTSSRGEEAMKGNAGEQEQLAETSTSGKKKKKNTPLRGLVGAIIFLILL